MESFVAARHSDWTVTGLPAFNDNYLWALTHEPSKRVIVVDPGCADTVQKFIRDQRLHLSGILITHHHPDHIGGVDALLKGVSGHIPVYGTERISQVNQRVRQGETLECIGLSLKVLEVPGHTRDHLAYVLQTGPCTWLFCGDTLFSAGCGRLFEGTAQDLFNSFNKFKALPDDTLVFCAHEYTESNLRFALHQAPGDPDLQTRMEEVQSCRRLGKSTIPTRLGLEKKTNLFLMAESSEKLGALRSAKDVF